eukprot:1144660-Pelagomonas_calceolata.AAC.9
MFGYRNARQCKAAELTGSYTRHAADLCSIETHWLWMLQSNNTHCVWLKTWHMLQTSEAPKKGERQGQPLVHNFRASSGEDGSGPPPEGRLAAAVDAMRKALARAYAALARGAAHVCFQVYQAYRVAGQTHELGPHWVMVHIQVGEAEAAAGSSSVQCSAGSEVDIPTMAIMAEAALNRVLEAAQLGIVEQEMPRAE